jgi:hypothetical protein
MILTEATGTGAKLACAGRLVTDTPADDQV